MTLKIRIVISFEKSFFWRKNETSSFARYNSAGPIECHFVVLIISSSYIAPFWAAVENVVINWMYEIAANVTFTVDEPL